MTPVRAVSAIVLLAPCAMAQTVPLNSLDCGGEEPFWGIRVNSTTAMVNRLAGAGNQPERFHGAFQEFSFLNPAWGVWRGTGAKAERVLTLTFREEACSSTMAEGPASSHRAVVTFPDGASAVGCCRAIRAIDAARAPLADPSKKPAEDWSRLVSDLVPAITKCVVDSGFPTTSVAKAWPMNKGKAGVRLSGSAGESRDCVTDITGKGATELAAADAALPGAGEPVYLPAREQFPLVECGRLEKVTTAKGVTAGWLYYRAGCPEKR